MIFKALNRSYLTNKAIRIYKKKKGLELTELSLNILYTGYLLHLDNKTLTANTIYKYMQKQSLFYSYDNVLIWFNRFVGLSVFVPSLTKDHCFTVSSYGVSVLNSFELCLRRVRHDR